MPDTATPKLKPLYPRVPSRSHPTFSVVKNDKKRLSRKYATRACLQCRRKRKRCVRNGDAACDFCTTKGFNCEVNEADDKRSSRHHTEYKQDHLLLEELLKTLGDNTASDDVLDLIRAQASKSQIAVHIRSTSGPGALDGDCEANAQSAQFSAKASPETPTASSVTSNLQYQSVLSDLVALRRNVTAFPKPDVLPWQQASVASVSPEARHGSDERQAKPDVPSSWIGPGAVRSFGNLALSDAIRANQYPHSIQVQQLRALQEPIEYCLPLHLDHNLGGIAGSAANAVLSFRDAARDQIARGVPARTVLSMDSFDIDLFSRDRTPHDAHTVASWASEWGKSWTHFPTDVCLASIYYTGSLIRWLIMPCKETYRAISPLSRPLPCQLFMPHTVDVDFWGAPPVMREVQLVHSGSWLNSVTPDTQWLHWPYGQDACTERTNVPCDATVPGATDDGLGNYSRIAERLSPAFIAFIDSEEAWSIHPDFLKEFPELRGRVRFHDDLSTTP